MKSYLKKITVMVLILIMVFALSHTQRASAAPINNVFRLHILADDNSFAAQMIKYRVRNAVLELEKSIFAGREVASSEIAKSLLMDNAAEINATINDVLKDNGVTYGVQMYVGVFDFPDRTYSKQNFPAGEYEALRIILGSGEGNNWWCVMFPPLCITGAGSVNTDKNADKAKCETPCVKSVFVDLYRWLVGVFDGDN